MPFAVNTIMYPTQGKSELTRVRLKLTQTWDIGSTLQNKRRVDLLNNMTRYSQQETWLTEVGSCDYLIPELWTLHLLVSKVLQQRLSKIPYHKMC